MALRDDRRSLGKLEHIAELDISVERTNAKKIATALENLSLRLPDSGRYYIEMSGSTLRVYERAVGIKKFDFSNKGQVDETEINGSSFEISITGGSVRKVILHGTPYSGNPDAVNLSDIGAPTTLMQEYTTLQAITNPTSDVLRRKKELLEKIREEFVRQQPPPSYTGGYSSTPQSSGESRGGGGVRASG